jgi:hypothetical protein
MAGFIQLSPDLYVASVALCVGYGSCPLTVDLGRVVLAEFGYGGKQLPTFPLGTAPATAKSTAQPAQVP